MVSYRVNPKPLARIRDLHVPGVFGNFAESMDSSIQRFQDDSNPTAKERVKFFSYLKMLVDADRFGAMQDHYLSDEMLVTGVNPVKYIDPIVWFVSKLSLARAIGLDRSPPLSILDIGTGPAHFPVVATFYGHRVLGTDLPSRITNQLCKGHLYDVLADIYKVRRIPLAISGFEHLPTLPERYDLITAFLAAFNVDRVSKKPWDIARWNFFLADVRDHVLRPGGQLFMTLDDKKLTDDVWDYLKARAASSLDKMKRIHFIDLSFAGSGGEQRS